MSNLYDIEINNPDIGFNKIVVSDVITGLYLEGYITKEQFDDLLKKIHEHHAKQILRRG